MAPRIFITGHTGILGVPLVEALKNDFDVTGVSRNIKQAYSISNNVTCDLTNVPDDLLKTARGNGLIFEHAILAANLCAMKPLGELTDTDITTSLAVGITSIIKIAQQLESDWKSCKRDAKYDRSITIVSSISAVNVYHKRQLLYGAIKAAQVALTDQLACTLAPLNVRVNVLLPNAFPAIVKTSDVVESIIRIIKSRDNRLKEYLL